MCFGGGYDNAIRSKGVSRYISNSRSVGGEYSRSVGESCLIGSIKGEVSVSVRGE